MSATGWIYMQTEIASRDGSNLWTVGFYDPSGTFHPESDHSDWQDAAKRVHYLNGGNDDGTTERSATAGA